MLLNPCYIFRIYSSSHPRIEGISLQNIPTLSKPLPFAFNVSIFSFSRFLQTRGSYLSISVTNTGDSIA